FFQAEDGIRDRNVTGVQTCALPILIKQAISYLQALRDSLFYYARLLPEYHRHSFQYMGPHKPLLLGERDQNFLSSIIAILNQLRSEERRVGKERRDRR